jgi:hypothetical protein
MLPPVVSFPQATNQEVASSSLAGRTSFPGKSIAVLRRGPRCDVTCNIALRRRTLCVWSAPCAAVMKPHVGQASGLFQSDRQAERHDVMGRVGSSCRCWAREEEVLTLREAQGLGRPVQFAQRLEAGVVERRIASRLASWIAGRRGDGPPEITPCFGLLEAGTSRSCDVLELQSPCNSDSPADFLLFSIDHI